MESPDKTNINVVAITDQSMPEEPIVTNEEIATSSNGDPITDKNTSIIKGKRTKRQRPQSPISFCLNLNDDNNNNNNRQESEGSRSDICINIQDMITTNLLSDDHYHTYKTKEEEVEEDIANCLILLAQGQPRYLWKNSYDEDDYKQPVEQKKFTSKKFLETPYGDKAGYYVYECKTCFKTFPSFQALGGHRASHVKPKKEENNTMSLLEQGKTHYTPSKTNLNGYEVYNTSNNKKPRIHECSACGAEFLSGQALGGHMRRHRTPGGARVNNVNGGSRHDQDDNYFPQLQSPLLTSTLSFMNSMDNNIRPSSSSGEANKLCLNLDLNLAAPIENESSKINHSTTKECSANKSDYHPHR